MNLRLVAARGRLAAPLLLAGLFIVIGTATRMGLVVFDHAETSSGWTRILAVLALGLVYDFVAAVWWTMPLQLVAWLWPRRRERWYPVAALLVAFPTLAAFLFVALAEWVFWSEFGTRFNFIAVDYLIYTREVVGSVRESYPLGPIMAGFAVFLALLSAISARAFRFAVAMPAGGWRARTAGMALFAAVAALATVGVDTQWKESLGSPQLAQLAGNGALEFFKAFRDNEIDFQRFYTTIPQAEVDRRTRAEFAGMPNYELTGSPVIPIERRVRSDAPRRPLNVVLVSVESLGAEFVESLGGKAGLTPELERLARGGLFFTRLYATGTRTVRGLEALTLSIPPTPGRAVLMRPRNKNLFTLGGVFRQLGYDAVYMYGGYSYFDGMKDFFGGNGYTVIDRTSFPKERISHETIWGVADEDLFREALGEIDRRSAAGRRVFLHVMTTSNHRPFTYPGGRIDIAPGTGRDGAVKYTDYAIGRFIHEASARPWFDDTIFVIVADHTSIGRGKTDLATSRYHIPMVIYAPRWIAPRRIDTVASQIDVAPTLLGLLNVEYVSQFFGRDILRDGTSDPHVYMANYQTVGFLDDGLLAELRPRRASRVLRQDTTEVVTGPGATEVLDEGIALYQLAAERFSSHRDSLTGRISPLASP